MLFDKVLSNKKLKEIYRTKAYNLKKTSVEYDGALSECVVFTAQVPKDLPLATVEESKTSGELSRIIQILKEISHSNLPQFVDSKPIRYDEDDEDDEDEEDDDDSDQDSDDDDEEEKKLAKIVILY